MKVGDLVTFNCAGSKGKTLALVLDVQEGRPMRRVCGEIISAVPGWIEVQWMQVSRWMPRVHATIEMRSTHQIEPGDIAKHPASAAFEVIE